MAKTERNMEDEEERKVKITKEENGKKMEEEHKK
jgi:hypothetical protein